MRAEFHPKIEAEFLDAVRFYEKKGGEGVATRFRSDFEACVTAIEKTPTSFPYYSGARRLRRIRLKRFPYLLIYREIKSGVRVIVLRHERRHPDFGLDRE